MLPFWKKLEPFDMAKCSEEVDEDLLFLKNEGFQPDIGRYIEQGLFDKNGVKSGLCRSFSRLEIYEGEFKDGKRNGFGRAVKVELISWTPQIYIGDWKDGKFHGQGCLVMLGGLNTLEG